MDKGGEGTTRGWIREGGGNKRVDKGRRRQQMVDKEGREGTARGGQGSEEVTMERVGMTEGRSS